MSTKKVETKRKDPSYYIESWEKSFDLIKCNITKRYGEAKAKEMLLTFAEKLKTKLTKEVS